MVLINSPKYQFFIVATLTHLMVHLSPVKCIVKYLLPTHGTISFFKKKEKRKKKKPSWKQLPLESPVKLSLKALADFQLGLSKTNMHFYCLLNAIKTGYYFHLLGMKKIRLSKAKWGLPVLGCLLPFHGCSQRLHGIPCLFSSPLAMALHLSCQLVTDGFLVSGCTVTEPWWALVIE